MEKSLNWLCNGVLILKILLISSCIVSAQDESESQPRPPENRATDSVYVEPGFYYLKNKVDLATLRIGGSIIKKSQGWIVYLPGQHVKASATPATPPDHSWKFSPQFRKINTHSELKITTRDVKAFLKEFDHFIDVRYVDPHSNSLIISCDNPEIRQRIYGSTLVTFIDTPGVKAEEEGLNRAQDISVNAVSAVHERYPLITGFGLTSSVKENTIDDKDIDLKGRYVSSSLASEVISLHANQMATFIAGGGNTSPRSKGIAWKSNISSSSFDNLFPDALAALKSIGVSVQNHSYGTQIENFYGAEARAYDLQTNEDLVLTHVFSSGNKGEEIPGNGTFSGVGTYANMTGNFKSAKNVIIAGAHYEDFSVDDRNSRGPAYDGRLKPEVVAFGPDGTSDGAAVVSGVVLLIQDAYKAVHNKLPESALVRSLLITGADDVFQPGIDYRTGYGSVNALTTLSMVQSQNIIEGEVDTGDEFQYTLSVAAGMKLLRLSLTWNDPAASPGSDRALINDLDLSMVDPDGRVYKPWVLSSYPHADSLAKAPRRAVDKLNNAELISVDQPKAGQYTIKVNASDLQGAQRFFITYHLQPENFFEWIYPLESNSLESGTDVHLRWATSFEGTASVEISLAGEAYQEISSNVNLATRVSRVSLPAHNGTIRLRMKIGTQYFYTGPLAISEQASLEVGYNCEESFMLTWPKLEDVTTYRIFALGEKYLEPILTTADTFVIRNKSGDMSYHYAVSPLVDDTEGYRSLTFDIRTQGVNCYFKTLSATPYEGGVRLHLSLSTLYNVDKIIFHRILGDNVLTFQPQSPLTYDVVTDDELSSGGVYRYRAEIRLQDGSSVFTDEVEALFSTASTYMLYPNPVRTSQTLRVLTDGKDLSLTIIDMEGRVITTHVLPNSLMEFSVNELLPGVYIYRVERGNTPVASGRVVIFE